MPFVGKVPPPTNSPAPRNMHPILSADRMPHPAHYIGTLKVVQHEVVLAAVHNGIPCGRPPTMLPPPGPHMDEQWHWLGLDDRGLELEVITVQTEKYLLVIHVMPTATQKEHAMTQYSGPWPPDDVELTLDDASDVDLVAEEIYDRRGNRIDQAYVDTAVEHVRQTVGRPSRNHTHHTTEHNLMEETTHTRRQIC